MLHIVSNSLLFERCLHYAVNQDEVILIEEGIQAILTPAFAKAGPKIYVLEHNILPHQPLNLVNYTQFVELVIKHPKTLTWF